MIKKERKKVFQINAIGTGKELETKTILKVTKETYKDRNINFRKYVKFLMQTMLKNEEFKTLNLSSGMYGIDLKLVIVPVEAKDKLIVPKKQLIKVVK